MEVRHGLRNDVVHRDEGALGVHRLAHGNREALGPLEEGFDQLRREIFERLVMVSRDEQGVAMKERTDVEECETDVILEHDVRRLVPGDDAAEEAVRAARRQL